MLIQHIQLRRERGWLRRRRLWSAQIAQPHLEKRVRIRKLMRRFDLRAAEVHAALAYELQPDPLQKLAIYGEEVYVYNTPQRALDVALDHLKARKGLHTIAAERQLTAAQVHAALSYYYDLHPADDNGYTANLHELIERLLRRGKTPPAPAFSITGTISSVVSSGWVSIIVLAVVAGTLNTLWLDETQDFLRDTSREVSEQIDDAQAQIEDGYDSLFPPDEGGTPPNRAPTPTATVTPRPTSVPRPTFTPSPTATVTPTATNTPIVIF